MRSALIGGPITTNGFGGGANTLSTKADLWTILAPSGNPAVLTLPKAPNDGDSFTVADGNNLAGGNITVQANTDFPLLTASGKATISVGYGSITFIFALWAGGWVALSSGPGGSSAPSALPAHNRAFVNNSIPGVTTPNAGVAATFAIAQAVAKSSGIFSASVSVAWADSSGAHAATDTYGFSVFTQTGTGPVTISNSAPATNGEGVSVSTSGAGMTITSGGGGTLQVKSDVIEGPASASTVAGFHSWSGIIQNSIVGAPEVPFPVGNNVFLIYILNASAHVPGLSFLSMSLVEQPN